MKRQPAFRLPVGPDDVVRHALASYYRAIGECTAPIADPKPGEWSDPDFFLEVLCDFLQLRMRCAAAAAGHEVASEPGRLATWLSVPMNRDRHIREVDPGLWDQMQQEAAERPSMAQGCAAVAVAVGPAPMAGQDGAEAPHADPFFAGPSGQELPAVAAADVPTAALEAASL
jgi:hypothetical protein